MRDRLRTVRGGDDLGTVRQNGPGGAVGQAGRALFASVALDVGRDLGLRVEFRDAAVGIAAYDRAVGLLTRLVDSPARIGERRTARLRVEPLLGPVGVHDELRAVGQRRLRLGVARGAGPDDDRPVGRLRLLPAVAVDGESAAVFFYDGRVVVAPLVGPGTGSVGTDQLGGTVGIADHEVAALVEAAGVDGAVRMAELEASVGPLDVDGTVGLCGGRDPGGRVDDGLVGVAGGLRPDLATVHVRGPCRTVLVIGHLGGLVARPDRGGGGRFAERVCVLRPSVREQGPLRTVGVGPDLGAIAPCPEFLPGTVWIGNPHRTVELDRLDRAVRPGHGGRPVAVDHLGRWDPLFGVPIDVGPGRASVVTPREAGAIIVGIGGTARHLVVAVDGRSPGLLHTIGVLPPTGAILAPAALRAVVVLVDLATRLLVVEGPVLRAVGPNPGAAAVLTPDVLRAVGAVLGRTAALLVVGARPFLVIAVGTRPGSGPVLAPGVAGAVGVERLGASGRLVPGRGGAVRIGPEVGAVVAPGVGRAVRALLCRAAGLLVVHGRRPGNGLARMRIGP